MHKADLSYSSLPVKNRGHREYNTRSTKCYFLTEYELNWVFLVRANTSCFLSCRLIICWYYCKHSNVIKIKLITYQLSRPYEPHCKSLSERCKSHISRAQRSSRNSSQVGGISDYPGVYYFLVQCEQPSTHSWIQQQHNDVFTRRSLETTSKKVLNGI